MDKVKIMNFIRVLVFNILETIVIFLLGKIFSVKVSIRIVLMGTFFLTRMIIGEPKHYKKAYMCALWSSLVFLSLYSLSSLDLIAIIILTVFTGFISTGRADINDMFMWGGNKLNNVVFDWVKFNQNNAQLLSYEQKLKETDNRKYIIFKYRFREFKSYSEIAELMEIDVQRISDEIKIMSHFIEYSIRLGGE